MTRGQIECRCSVARTFHAYRIVRTPACATEGIFEETFEAARLCLSDQSTKCALGVSGGGVDEKAVHGLVDVLEVAIEPLAKGRRAVSARKGQLLDKRVRECVD